MLRRFLEIASRRFVFKRRLPKRFGGRSFYASAEGGLRYFRPNLLDVDPVLLESVAYMVSPGDIVWDVGANVGLFAFAASGLAGWRGCVYAIEPDTLLVERLRRSACLPDLNVAPVHVIPVAVAQELDIATFQVAERARAANHLGNHGSTQSGGVREFQKVMTVSLDWLATKLPPPTVLKIDTEGAEVSVLRGACEILTRHRPKLLCEVANENADDVSEILESCGYRMYDAERPETQISRAAWNTLAMPDNDTRLHVATV
jgi:FkbM family methyltransferase